MWYYWGHAWKLEANISFQSIFLLNSKFLLLFHIVRKGPELNMAKGYMYSLFYSPFLSLMVYFITK